MLGLVVDPNISAAVVAATVISPAASEKIVDAFAGPVASPASGICVRPSSVSTCVMTAPAVNAKGPIATGVPMPLVMLDHVGDDPPVVAPTVASSTLPLWLMRMSNGPDWGNVAAVAPVAGANVVTLDVMLDVPSVPAPRSEY